MNNLVYQKVREFKEKYPFTIAWRLKAHSKVAQSHLDSNEKVKFAFAAQKNDKWYDIMYTNVIVLTNQRIIIAHKRLLFGYFYTSITPEMFNDLKVTAGLLWGKIHIDTVKEYVVLSNVSKSALAEIETSITGYMMKKKKEFAHPHISIEPK